MLDYFEECGIPVRKRESISGGNYVFLAILHDLNLLPIIFLSALGQSLT